MIINPARIIINKRELQTGSHKALSLILFLIFWAGLLYLLRPLVILLGWVLAWFIFDSTLQHTESIGAIGSVIEKYFPIVLALSLTFVSWSLYNKIRFSGKRDKRRSRGKPSQALSVMEISEASALQLSDISQMREAPMVICYFDEKSGEIKDMECCSNLDDADMALAVKLKDDNTRAALKEAERALEAFDDMHLQPALTAPGGSGLPPTVRARSEHLANPIRPAKSDPLQPSLPGGRIELDLSPHEAELIKNKLPSGRTPLRK